MVGFYVVKINDKGQFWFVLRAANNETILRSQMYSSLASAKKGIESVRMSCDTKAGFVRVHNSEKNTFHFNLTALNGRVIGTSETYESESSCEKGIDSVCANGTSTMIVLVPSADI